MLKILLLESFNFETCRIKNFRSPRGLGREASRTMKFSSLPLGTMSRAEAIEEGNFLIFPIIRNLLVRQSQRAWHRRIFMMENCWHISSIVIQLPFVAPSSVEALPDAPWRPLILQINWCGRETSPCQVLQCMLKLIQNFCNTQNGYQGSMKFTVFFHAPRLDDIKRIASEDSLRSCSSWEAKC